MLGFFLYLDFYLPKHTILILKSLDGFNLMKLLPNPGQKCHIYTESDPNCEEQYCGVTV